MEKILMTLLHLSVIQTKLLRIAKRTSDDELRRLALDAAFLIDKFDDKKPQKPFKAAND